MENYSMKIYPNIKRTYNELINKLKSSNRPMILVMIAIILTSLVFNIILTLPYHQMNNVKFQNLDELKLSARYSPSKNGQGVIIVPDLNKEKSQYSELVSLLLKQGYGVYIFDFPSLGNSDGYMTFDYKNNTYLAEQFYTALVSYAQMDKLNEDNIHIISYGAGSRAVLQTASMDFIHPRSMSLVVPEISLDDKLQLNLLNFAQDKSIQWLSDLNNSSGGCNINIYYSNFDEYFNHEDQELLKSLLTTSSVNESNIRNEVESTKINFTTHNKINNSYRANNMIVKNLCELDEIEYMPGYIFILRTPSIILFFITLILFMCFYKTRYAKPNLEKIKMRNDFIFRKCRALLPTIIILTVIPIAFYYLPIPYPSFDIFRISCTASFGITLYLLYRFTNYQENIGEHIFISRKSITFRPIAFVGVLFILLVTALYYAGIKNYFSLQYGAILWNIICTTLLIPIFYIDEKESLLIDASLKLKLINRLINFSPIIIFTLIFLVLGQFAQVSIYISSVFCLIIILSLENILVQLKSSTFINCTFKAILFQWLVFTQMTLFN